MEFWFEAQPERLRPKFQAEVVSPFEDLYSALWGEDVIQVGERMLTTPDRSHEKRPLVRTNIGRQSRWHMWAFYPK